MRIDELKTDEAKANALAQMVEFNARDGFDKFMDEVAAYGLRSVVDEFECCLYEDGTIAPPDDCYDLWDLLRDFCFTKYDVDDPLARNEIMNLLSVCIEHGKMYADEHDWNVESIDSLALALRSHGIVFDEDGILMMK